MADGALLVVRAGSTPYDLVQRAVDALGRNQLLGVVLNQAASTPHGQYDYNYYYGSQLPAARRKSRERDR